MRMMRVGCLALVLCSSVSLARDWFVRDGASGGDGSQSKPFADPWQALDACQANDVIHVAGGRYYGRNRVGTWAVPFDGVQVLGGYDTDFKTRDPWKNLTRLEYDATSKNWPKDERLRSTSRNVVIDGLVLDMRDQNKYEDDAQTGRDPSGTATDAMFFNRAVTIRNCILVNAGQNGMSLVQGSTVENNLIMNAYGWGVVINQSSNETAAATVKNNTIVFSQDPKEPGTGRYQGAALAIQGPAVITNNILANSDNNAVYLTVDASKVTLTGNVFSMNLFSNVKVLRGSEEIGIADADMDSLDEVGFKAASDNAVTNPKFELDPKWLDRFSKRTSSKPGKLKMDDWNVARQLMGLPLIGTGGENASGVCPAYDLDKALKLMTPRAQLKAGARIAKLEAKFSGGGDAGPARTWAKSDVAAWVKNAASVDGQALEITVALGSTGANVSSIPSSYKPDDYAGVVLYTASGDHERLLGFYKKGSSAQRFVEENDGQYNGSGTPPKVYTAKGVAYGLKGLPKSAFLIESIDAQDAAGSSSAGARPTGRDWFVRAGATGGDGSKDKPFKDPWQALEKVEAGDSVHVAEGEYFGKLKVGKWKVAMPYVALIGGYDKDFTERNPWKHPTRLFTPADFKGTRDGYTVEGSDDHTGAIVDGFVFDKKLNNLYEPNGDLMYSQSPDKKEHIWFAKPGCIIRNNVFLNGDEGALRVAGGQTIENNIFINHAYRTVRVERGFGGVTTIRSNTMLFSWDPIRFGQGHGSNGSLLALEGQTQTIVDNNLFEFADNDAIRMAAEAKDVELTNNTFSKNLWSNVQRVTDWVAVDDKEWSSLADLKFKKLSGNVLMTSGVPLDQKWFDVYLSRVAPVPGKVKMDDWNQLRELLGQPVIATGSVPGKGFAPAYDWQKALLLFPKNPKVTSGARAKSFPVSFTGVARTEESFEYAESSWDVAKDGGKWNALDGKRVSMKVVIRDPDTQYQLDDVKKEQFQAFTVTGVEGTDSGGLPMRMYVKRGTKHERLLNDAPSYSSGPPKASYVVKGVVRAPRQMVVEVIERAD